MAIDDSQPPPNHTDFHVWRGTVDEKLDELVRKVDRLETKLDRIERGLSNGDSPYVTWAYLRDRLVVPIIVAGILFFMLTVCPWLLIAGYLVTQQLP
jgi:hypothetical protein